MTFWEYIKKSNSGKWIFPLVVNSKIKNIRRIHPLKQKQVDEIVSSIIKEDDVKRLIVFGSATSNMCHEGSDLDICVVWNFDCFDGEGVYVPKANQLLKRISKICEGNVDIMPYTSWMSDEIKEEILKGVTVYVQNAQKIQSV